MRVWVVLCLLGASLLAAGGQDSAPAPDSMPGPDSPPGLDSAPMDTGSIPVLTVPVRNDTASLDDSVRPHLDLGYNGTRAELRRLYARVEPRAYSEREVGAACADVLALLLAPFVLMPFGTVQYGLGDGHCPRGAVRRGPFCVRRK